jgi:hypothetical protein
MLSNGNGPWPKSKSCNENMGGGIKHGTIQCG